MTESGLLGFSCEYLLFIYPNNNYDRLIEILQTAGLDDWNISKYHIYTVTKQQKLVSVQCCINKERRPGLYIVTSFV